MAILRNEQDVREEIASPFLKSLGYESGTANDIEREHRLRYAAMQLGRKKQNDALLPQGGNADYLLTVAGAGRWVLETKPPSQEIALDDIDQAVSYARHPEVSGHYAAVLNGERFVLYFSSQTSDEKPLVDLEVISGEELAKALSGLLGPLAIRRDCTPPKVDLRAPLAPGFRSEAAIVSGWNKQVAIDIETRLPIPQSEIDRQKAQYLKIVGMRSTIKHGRVWRDEASRIRVRLSWHPPHEDMKPLLEAARLDDFEYVCLGETISTNAENPSVFDILAAFELRQGQVAYDLLQWKTQVLGFDTSVAIQGQATGYLEGIQLAGIANFRSTSTIKGLALPIIVQFATEFSFTIDAR
jgi:hypothetical protein